MPATTGERAATDAVPSTAIAIENMVDGNTPDVETGAYRRSKARWEKCRDLMVGVEKIREGATKYLPQYTNESNTMYEARRTIAALFNGYARTVEAVVGILLDKEPKLSEDMPQALVDLAENVDGIGTHLAVFAKKLATHVTVDGFGGILTEYPRANDPRIDRSKASYAATLALATGEALDPADEKAMGLRPYFIAVKADQVLLALYQSVNGQRTLVMLIMKEVVTERKGKFGLESKKQFRIYQLLNGKVFYELWHEDAGEVKQREQPTEMRNIRSIPWSPFIAGAELGPGEYKPALMDLAELNLTHHRIATGILSLEELACVPTPVRVGAQATMQEDGTLLYPPLVLGPGNTIEAPATEGVATPVYWLAPPIDVLEPAMRSLENTKAEMAAMGATFLAPDRAQETATAHRMRASAERASVATVSRALQDCLEAAFGFAGQYIRQEAGSVAVNQDFIGEGVDPAYLQVIVQAYQAGSVTLEELRYVLQTGKLPETFDAEDVLKLLVDRAADDNDADEVE